MIIKHSISADLRRVFPDKTNNKELTAKEFYNSIRMLFLIKKLICSRYDWQSGLSEHIKHMFNITVELKELGVFISDDSLAKLIMSSLPEYHARNDEFLLVCSFCKLPGHVMSQCAKYDEWLQKKGN